MSCMVLPGADVAHGVARGESLLPPSLSFGVVLSGLTTGGLHSHHRASQVSRVSLVSCESLQHGSRGYGKVPWPGLDLWTSTSDSRICVRTPPRSSGKDPVAQCAINPPIRCLGP